MILLQKRDLLKCKIIFEFKTGNFKKNLIEEFGTEKNYSFIHSFNIHRVLTLFAVLQEILSKAPRKIKYAPSYPSNQSKAWELKQVHN